MATAKHVDRIKYVGQSFKLLCKCFIANSFILISKKQADDDDDDD